jgi:trehalose 6-phosphate phosphatase
VKISKKQVDAVVFDLDGVVTKTAGVHAAAWKRLFDEYLAERAAREGRPFRSFDVDADYRRYVDGKPRYDGVASFLESRGISLGYGEPSDPPDRETVCGLGNRKNSYFQEHVAKHGVNVYESTIDLIRGLRAHGVKTAIISASRNCEAILKATNMTELRSRWDFRANQTRRCSWRLPGVFGSFPSAPSSSRTQSPAYRQPATATSAW